MGGPVLTLEELRTNMRLVIADLEQQAGDAERQSAQATVSASADSDVSSQLAINLAVRAEERRYAADLIRAGMG